MRKTTKRKPTKILVPSGEALSAKLKELSAKYLALTDESVYTTEEIKYLSNIQDAERNSEHFNNVLAAARKNYIAFRLSN